jgi:hypothetical protein
MSAGRRNAMKRTGAVVAGVLLVGLVASGVATAQVRTGVPAPRVAQAVADVLSGLGSDGTSGTSSTSSPTNRSVLLGVLPDASSSSSSTGSTSTSSTSTGSTSTSSTSTSSGSTSSSTGGLSTNSYVITFPPTPGPTGSDGHRYYGRYWDASADCWRYASPNYVPQPIVATQVASVPKGGVNTGDGSFR